LEAQAQVLRSQADVLEAGAESSRLLTLAQVCDTLNVHHNTALSMVQSGELLGSKIRGQWRVSPSEVARLIDAGRPAASLSLVEGSAG
jgi:excisionase family DNA binding protein